MLPLPWVSVALDLFIGMIDSYLEFVGTGGTWGLSCGGELHISSEHGKLILQTSSGHIPSMFLDLLPGLR